MSDVRSTLGNGRQKPDIADVPFRSLYDKETYEFDTSDQWRLVITRYQGRAQAWHPRSAPRDPVLLVHGFSQNRHAWTAGDFVKRLVYRGMDVHILELRGHGKSNRALQEDTANRFNRSVPTDWNYAWDFSDYFVTDVPAAIQAIKAKTGASKVLYIGHSMGGIIGYGLAATRGDIRCLMTLGSPVRLGSESTLVSAIAQLEPIFPVVKHLIHITGKGLRSISEPLTGTRLSTLHQEALPTDLLLGRVYRRLSFDNLRAARSLPRAIQLFSLRKAQPEPVRWILERSESREPYRVLRTFARWVRRRELVCPRTGFDFQKSFERIRIPTVIA